MNLGQTIGQAAAGAIRQQQVRWVAHELGSWAIQYVREEVENLDPVFFTRWQTQDDERTCPICGQLNGNVWEKSVGWFPPVHDHCRCERVYDHVEFRIRKTEIWRAVPTWQTRTEWRLES